MTGGEEEIKSKYYWIILITLKRLIEWRNRERVPKVYGKYKLRRWANSLISKYVFWTFTRFKQLKQWKKWKY